MNTRLTERVPLQKGRHRSPDDGLCAMEMVAWLAGEAHTDEPRCASPVLAAVVRAVNDLLPDDHRSQVLRPLLPLLVNSRADAATEAERALRMVDVAVRELAPMDLHRRGRTADAEAMQRLDPVVDAGSLGSAAAWARVVMPEHRPLQWLLRRAASGDAAVAWVAAVVLVAEPLGTRGLSELSRSVMAALATPRRPVSVQRSPS